MSIHNFQMVNEHIGLSAALTLVSSLDSAFLSIYAYRKYSEVGYQLCPTSAGTQGDQMHATRCIHVAWFVNLEY